MNRNEGFPGGMPGDFPGYAPEMPSAEEFSTFFEEKKETAPAAPAFKNPHRRHRRRERRDVDLRRQPFRELPENNYDVTFLSTAEHPFFESQIKERYGRIKVIRPGTATLWPTGRRSGRSSRSRSSTPSISTSRPLRTSSRWRRR